MPGGRSTTSIAVPWVEINTYVATIGPGLAGPPRPTSCSRCDATRISFDGWRRIYPVVLVDQRPHRLGDGVWLRRVECSSCHASWTIRPPFLYPHRAYQPDIDEAAVVAYLSVPDATYRKVGTIYGCAPSTVWRWTAWASSLGEPATVVAEAARSEPAGGLAPLIPREVPQSHPKARTSGRHGTLLRAFQLLVAVALLARAATHPPDDPSALRSWLHRRFLVFRVVRRRSCTRKPEGRRKHALRQGRLRERAKFSASNVTLQS